MRRTLRYLSVVLALMLSVTMGLTPALAAPGDAPTMPFDDAFGTEYAQPIGALYGLGVISGQSAHTFGVNAPVTRAQMAVFLARATKLDKDGPVVLSSLFGDVSSNYWAYDAINKAAMSGYISGYQGQFRPEDPVTEAEAVTMELRALGYGGSNLDYPVGYVLKARSVGLLPDSIAFSINQQATRGWIAETLAQMVFAVPVGLTNLTLSQTKFQSAVAVSLGGNDYLLPGNNQLTVDGLDAYGKSFAVSGATWQVDGAGATVTSSGVANVTGSGVVNVTATVNGVTVTKAYDVLQSLVATPSSISLQPGATAKVSVDGVTAGGKRYSVGPTLQVVSGPFTIASDGTISANGSGNGVVRATVGSLKVDIPAVSATAVTVSPANIVLAPGQQQQFQVVLPGTTTPIDSSAVTWSVQGAGTISNTGLYTAAASTSSPVITAKVGTLTASATVKVISALQIQPAQAAVVIGQDQTFTINGLTSAGDTVPVTGATCALSGNVGLLGGCHMAALSSGQGTLTATYAGLSATASVTVSGAAKRILVTPDKQSVPANGHSPITLTVQLVDDNNVPVPRGNQVVTLSLSPAELGTLSSTQVALSNGVGTVTFTPTTQVGNLTLLATVADGSLFAGITSFNTYLPTPAQVRLTAGPATMQAAPNTWSTVTATLLDTDGQPMIAVNLVAVNLNLQGTNIGSLQNTTIQIPAGQSSGSVQFLTNGFTGSTTILGAAPYPVTSATLTAMNAGPAARVHIRTGIAAGTADYSALPVYVEVQDANGVVRTADASGAVAGTLTCGSTSTSYTAGINSGVATFQIQSRVAGNCTFTASAPWLGANDTATVTFKAGTATQVLLSSSSGGNVPADGVSQTNLVAKIADAYGNVVTDGSWIVTFSKSVDTQATIAPSNMMVSTVNGVATLPITGARKIGSDTYTATVLGLSTVGDSGTGNVTISSRIYGTATQLVVTNVSSTSPLVGQSVTVTVAVEDANNYIRTQDNGTLVFLSSNSSTAVITPAQQMVTGGVATFTITDSKADNLVLTASAGNLQSAALPVAYQTGTVARVTLTADATQLAADGLSQTNIRAQAVDQYGNVITGGFSLTLNLSNALGNLSNSVIYGGNFSVIFTAGVTPGTVTVSGAPGSGYTVDPVVIKLGTPGTPSRLVVDAPATIPATFTPTVVRVRLYDTNGNVMGALTSGSDLSQIGLQITGGSGAKSTISNNGGGILTNYGYVPDGVTRGAMPAVNGVASFNVSDTNLETLTLTPIGYYKGVPLQGQPQTVTVTAGAVAALKLMPGAGNVVTYDATSASHATFTISLVDANGNTVVPTTPDTITLTLASTANMADPSPVRTYTTVNGMATVSLSTKAGGFGTTTGTVTSAQTGKVLTFSLVGDKVPDAPTVYAIDNNGGNTIIDSSKLGVKVTIVPTATYTRQTILTTVNGRMVTMYTDTTFSQVINSIDAGSSSIVTGYIRRGDLGGLGPKAIQVVLQNGLGTGAASLPVYVNVTQ